MINNIKYYLIHNTDPTRKAIMINEFNKWGFDLNNINWINHPNKNEITDEFVNNLIIQEPSYSSGILVHPDRLRNGNGKGIVCCSYKHYLCLKDIVENNYDYGVIMEDNICFKGKIPELVQTYIKQLNENYGEWDILFDGSWTSYTEKPTRPGLLVYPKKNEITNQCHGGTKAATFYLLTKSCAKKLMENYIPFNNSPDWWMNDLFRKLNIKSFWVEPTNVYVHHGHVSTCSV
jgi:GR25 family glycosyltransferase involved in LPS biosynthesis